MKVCAVNYLKVLFALGCLTAYIHATDHAILAGEAHAFKTLYGTTDFSKLKKIEKDPDTYWAEREHALLHGENKTIPHREFCTQFVKDAQSYIAEKLYPNLPWCVPYCVYNFLFEQPWYANLNTIDGILSAVVGKSHPALPTARTLFYGGLVDYLNDIHDDYLAEIFETPGSFRASIVTFMKEDGYKITKALNDKQRWFISEDGAFSLFDELVMLNNGFYLCGAPRDPESYKDFATHYSSDQPDFSGWRGLISHDPLAHALTQEDQDIALRNNGVLRKNILKNCYAPGHLPKNNLIKLSQKTQGVFYAFHEAPSVTAGYLGSKAHSIAFPPVDGLIDTGFLAITPYFTENASQIDWHTQVLTPEPLGLEHVHDTLLQWRKMYCADAFEKALKLGLHDESSHPYLKHPRT